MMVAEDVRNCLGLLFRTIGQTFKWKLEIKWSERKQVESKGMKVRSEKTVEVFFFYDFFS